jgi:hypothetical protein
LRRQKPFIVFPGLAVVALLSGGFVASPGFQTSHTPLIVKVQAIESPDIAPPVNSPVPSQPQSEISLSPAEQKAVADRLAFNRVLVDAAVLKNSYEEFKRGKSKTPVSLSAFRNLELQLNAIASADPANMQAREWANAMRMAQFEILQPSVQIAASANRQLYAHEMAVRMRDDGTNVLVSGDGNSVIRFQSPHMTRQVAMQLAESAKIPEQAKALQFRRVVFGNGRRSWTYDFRRGRIR